MTLIDIVDDLLPQTQCRQCGFNGCRAYAEAMVRDGVMINRCAPGGDLGIRRLSEALGRPYVELDPEYGHEVPFAVARIREKDCIGCAWCTQVCPTGAIAGSPKHLHGIIESDCTGCSLCLASCPMDCIELIENGHVWSLDDAHRARDLFRKTSSRRKARAEAESARLAAIRKQVPAAGKKSSLIADIMAKAHKANLAQKK